MLWEYLEAIIALSQVRRIWRNAVMMHNVVVTLVFLYMCHEMPPSHADHNSVVKAAVIKYKAVCFARRTLECQKY